MAGRPGHLPGWTEVAVTFEATGTGTRVHIVHSGFGESEEWLGELVSVRQGLADCVADLALYLETGVRFNRMFTWRWRFGAVIEPSQAGARVAAVQPEGFAARAGLRPGDLVLKIGEAPIFALADIWLVRREHRAGEMLDVWVAREGEVVCSSART